MTEADILAASTVRAIYPESVANDAAMSAEGLFQVEEIK
jgi:hypothetical protein